MTTGGNVGIGTTNPTAKLHVAGTARITDTVTLAPLGDQALNLSTGSIYKNGALFIHTKGGMENTALGVQALASVTTGTENAASGHQALFSNTTGSFNTASGFRALHLNTSGDSNTANGNDALVNNTAGDGNTASGFGALRGNATGYENTASGRWALRDNSTGSRNTAGGAFALFHNTTGSFNTASGYGSLRANSTGDDNVAVGSVALIKNTTGFHNTALGSAALFNNTTGDRNVALGRYAGFNWTTGNDNIAIANTAFAGEGATTRIGTVQTRAFIAGIRGVTTGVANAIPVLVDSTGQLGTVSSSRRFKEEIRDMGEATERLLELRPVVFRYKPEVQEGERPLEYGLIAEEVAEVFPELVVYDEEGRPFTVKYHLLSSMLLNELQRLNAAHEREVQELHERLEAQADDHAHAQRALETRLAVVEARTTGAALALPLPKGR